MYTHLLFIILLLNSLAFSYYQICNRQDQGSLLDFSTHISTISSSPLNWSSAASCCQWEGVECDRNGKVTHLQLPSRGLEGLITSSIKNLSRLTHLNLSTNFLHGPLGMEIVSLTNLRILDLSSNNIVGSIPQDLGNLLYLEKVYLHANGLNGPIPPSLMNCTNLVEIILRDNLLHGDISKLDFAKLVHLQKLDLANNSFSGTLPKSIYSCKSLIAIRVSENNVTGQISPRIVTLTSLSFISLNDNSLTNVKEMLRVLAKCKNLTTLFLSSNFHNEILPIQSDFIGLNEFPKLQFLGLAYCNFSGPIPYWISNLKRLVFLNLGRNKFTGRIPDWLGTLPNLSRLILDENHLTGEFPLTLCKSPALVSQAFYASFDTELPVFSMVHDGKSSKQFKAFQRGISLSSNRLSGNIPSNIGNLQNLQLLILSDNFFSGHIPVTISNIKNLQVLDLSRNNLSGKIPESFSSLHFLSSFNVSFNNLEGPIPTGGQLNTFQESSYKGNPALCGEPLNHPCSPTMRPKVVIKKNASHDRKKQFVNGLFVGLASGFSSVLVIMAFHVWFKNYKEMLVS